MAMEGDGDRLRSPRRRWGCLALVVALAILAAMLGYAILMVFSFRECNPPRTISADTSALVVALSVDHPVVEQQVTVHVPAAGLPDQRRADAVTLDIEPGPAQRPASPTAIHTVSGSSPSAAGTAGTTAVAIQFAFVRVDTGEVVGRVSSPGVSGDAAFLPSLATLHLDCEVGRDCDRAYQIVASLPTGAATPAGSVSWIARVTIDWGFDTCSGPPYAGRPSITLGEANVIGADRVARARLPSRTDTATILARHVSVTSDSVPSLAYGHMSVRRSGSPWVPWLRILADSGGDPIVDAPLTDVYGGQQGRVIDFPILADCQAGSLCRRGYWVLIQAMPGAGFGPELGWRPGAGLGSIDWQLDAIATRPADGAGPSHLSLAVDDEPSDLGPAPILETDTVTMNIQADVERFVDVTLHLPEVTGSPAPSGLDPRRVAYVVANISGFGTAHGYRLEGKGAGPFVGGANGGSSANLIAHSFDACPVAESCDAVVRVVGMLNPDPSVSMSGTPNVTFRLGVLGGPPGTTATIGPVQERPRTDGTAANGGIPLTVIILGSLALAGAGLFAIRACRRARV